MTADVQTKQPHFLKNNALYDLARSFYHRRGVEKYKTRFSPRESAEYFRYWREARKIWKRELNVLPAPLFEAAENFHKHRFCTYTDAQTIRLAKKAKEYLAPWFDKQKISGYQVPYTASDPWEIPGINELFTGDMKHLIEEMMGSSFKLLFGIAARSIPMGDNVPTDGYNSFLWHADGGPPTCINMMFCLDDTDEENGALEIAPNKLSMQLLTRSVTAWRGISQLERTKKFADVMNASKTWYRASVPAGSVVFFSNNLVHKGGLATRHMRDVVIFHLYPSTKTFNAADVKGIKKTMAIPNKPDF